MSTAIVGVFNELTFGCDALADIFASRWENPLNTMQQDVVGTATSFASTFALIWICTERMLTYQSRTAELVLCGYFSTLRWSFFLEILTSPDQML